MGAGYHGGFGATKGSALKILPSAGSTPAIKINVSKQDIINALIEIAPRQIFIHTDTNLARDVIERIETLFPNCVCIEYNAVL